MKEIMRIDVTKNLSTLPSIELSCVECGKDVVLFFNGGELDVSECCGLKYELTHKQIDLVVTKKENKV